MCVSTPKPPDPPPPPPPPPVPPPPPAPPPPPPAQAAAPVPFTPQQGTMAPIVGGANDVDPRTSGAGRNSLVIRVSGGLGTGSGLQIPR